MNACRYVMSNVIYAKNMPKSSIVLIFWASHWLDISDLFFCDILEKLSHWSQMNGSSKILFWSARYSVWFSVQRSLNIWTNLDSIHVKSSSNNKNVCMCCFLDISIRTFVTCHSHIFLPSLPICPFYQQVDGDFRHVFWDLLQCELRPAEYSSYSLVSTPQSHVTNSRAGNTFTQFYFAPSIKIFPCDVENIW